MADPPDEKFWIERVKNCLASLIYRLQCRVFEGITGLEPQASISIQGMTEFLSFVG